MKKFKSVACLILAMLTFMTMFAATASAAELPDKATLHITKYQVTDSTGNVDTNTIIGNTDTLTGTTADAPTGRTALDGVTFTIYKVGTLSTAAPATADVNSFTKVTEVTTANGGKAEFTVSSADFGLYYVVETSAPAQVTTISVPFYVYLPMTNEAGTGFMSDVYAYPKNYIPLGGAQLKKVDGTTPLAGVEFKLYKKDGSLVTEDYLGNAIGTFVTDAQGLIKVENLPVGDYYFLETKTLDGYILKTDKYNFTVSASKIGVQTLADVQNSTQPQIHKYVTEIGKYEDTTAFNEFENTKQKWIIVSDVPSDMNADVYTQYVITDDMDDVLIFDKDSVKAYVNNGTAYTALDASDYTVSDADADNIFTVTVTNLEALEGVKDVKVEFNTTLDESAVMHKEYYNDASLTFDADNIDKPYTVKIPQKPYVYTGGYQFVKVNASNSPLKGAKFDLYKDGVAKAIKTDITTGTDGIIDIKGLAYGKYYLVETQAPEGYELRAGKIEFTVAKDTYTATPTAIVNQATPQLPITGGMGTVIFTVAGLGLITLSVVFFVASKKSKKEN